MLFAHWLKQFDFGFGSVYVPFAVVVKDSDSRFSCRPPETYVSKVNFAHRQPRYGFKFRGKHSLLLVVYAFELQTQTPNKRVGTGRDSSRMFGGRRFNPTLSSLCVSPGPCIRHLHESGWLIQAWSCSSMAASHDAQLPTPSHTIIIQYTNFSTKYPPSPTRGNRPNPLSSQLHA